MRQYICYINIFRSKMKKSNLCLVILVVFGNILRSVQQDVQQNVQQNGQEPRYFPKETLISISHQLDELVRGGQLFSLQSIPKETHI